MMPSVIYSRLSRVKRGSQPVICIAPNALLEKISRRLHQRIGRKNVSIKVGNHVSETDIGPLATPPPKIDSMQIASKREQNG